MPIVHNMRSSYTGINSAVESVVAYLYTGSHQYTQTGNLPAEDAADPSVAHFVIYEGFDRRNGAGNSLGRGSLDTGVLTLAERYGAGDIETLLRNAFPEAGPD